MTVLHERVCKKAYKYTKENINSLSPRHDLFGGNVGLPTFPVISSGEEKLERPLVSGGLI